MKPFFLPLAAALTLLLPSCVYSNFGPCIRNSGLVHTAVDVRHPVDGKFYCTPGQRKDNEAYVRAPELRYRLDHPFFIRYNIKGDCNSPEPYDIRPTGKERLALATCYDRTPWRFKITVDELPANARAYKADIDAEDEPELDDDSPAPKPATWRYVAAAPFDYLIDPVLTVALNTTEYTLYLVALPFLLTAESLFCGQQQQAVPPPPPPVPAP